MIFLYLIGIGVIGIAIICYREYRRSGSSLKQIFSTLLIIDSARFEKKLERTKMRTVRYYALLQKKGKDQVSKVLLGGQKTTLYLRHTVRKKLQKQGEPVMMSSFIQNMKEHKQ